MAFTDGQTLTAAQLNAAFAQYLATGTCSAAILALLGAANGPAALSAIGAASAATVAGLVGAMVYQGAWNASTNSPTLASGVGTKGYVFKVSVAGTTTLDGNSVWSVGDIVAFNGTTYDKFDGPAEAVFSVAGRVGAVTLASADLTDATTFGRSLLTAANAAAAKIALAIAVADVSGAASVVQTQTDVLQHATTVAGSVDAITLAFTPTLTALTNRMRIRWTSAGVNATTTPTINCDTLGAITVVKGASAALVAGDIGVAGTVHEAVYNGTNFVLLNPASIVRRVLTSNLTYYFRSDGSDSNTGLVNSSGGAFLTFNKAMSVIAGTLDTAGFAVTIQRGDAVDSTTPMSVTSWVGGGIIIFDGNSRTFNPTNLDCFGVSGVLPGTVLLQNATLKTTTSGICLNHSAVGKVNIGTGITFGAAGGAHIQVNGAGAYLGATFNYAISGGAPFHWVALHRGFIQIDSTTITITGTPAFSSSFAFASDGGAIETIGNTFSGSATGSRYNVANFGFINTNGAGTSALPGNAAGTGTNPSVTPWGLYA